MSSPAADPADDDPAFVDIERIGPNFQLRVTLLQFIDVAPVGRDGLAVEHARGRQHEYTGTDRTQTRAALIGSADFFQKRFGRHFVRIAPAGNDDGVGLLQQFERVRRRDGDAARRANRTGFAGAHREAIPVDVKLGTFECEQFGHATEFEGAEPVVSQRDDEMIVHGAMLPEIGITPSESVRTPRGRAGQSDD
jgi:hypothetical protein